MEKRGIEIPSLRPLAIQVDAETIRPSRKTLKQQKKRRLRIALSVGSFSTISAAAFVYFMFFDPVLGAYRLFAGFLAGLVIISHLLSLTLILTFLPWKDEENE